MADNLTLKALSRLLLYPEAALQDEAPHLAEALADDGRLDAATCLGLMPLLRSLAGEDLYDLQEVYVSLFDRTRRLSLHLFEHVHGESRDRGQAMVDLAALYAQGGLAIDANELPDFLPLFLEFLSTRPEAEAQGLLADVDHILATLEERLSERGSLYAAVLAAVRHLAGAEAVTAPEAKDRAAPDLDALDLTALDKEWEETAVTFGPGDAASCGVDRFRTQLRAAQRDARHPARQPAA
ncbi:nitrate reductase delta subunit [Xanthobacter flavus]|uniref:Nitrate reductase delta subunit n=1 Tax=Xanthobacter flavus TaxID=281 RepID=A0A9W6CGD4_XANFL|nr:nitrate reductase molybdenum cofactor assembly chaperone [Xanthobacter flavus]MDR6333366.1 nitrate reductase delta subunit [Xanthobacter flavus]GLI21641.1 nitrate reductase molybdenum cofactor assembly chaperone [Xanthobacter flavus]